MTEATIIYPHQLFKSSPAVKDGRPIYLIEEPLLLTHNPIHRQKLVFHKLSLDAYQAELETKKFNVIRLSIKTYPKTEQVFAKLKKDGISKIHIVDTTDNYLEKAIAESGLERVWYESPLFILEKDEACSRYNNSKRFMSSFYKRLRRDLGILITDNKEPVGGKWSFDEDNRQKLPKDIELPTDLKLVADQKIKMASKWAETVKAEKYGEAGCWLPYTRKGAEKFLAEFFRSRFHYFGTYEDAMTTKGTRLFHSTLSPLLNVGLLEPRVVIEEATKYAKQNSVPINSLEGFVRQILGWREFIRASYECDGIKMRTTNFWQHNNQLPKEFWNASTKIPPLDTSINNALSFGYNHHIERLMVLGNFMLLSQTDPDEVYRWFMAMYVDAYDWVMVPNVYGMSQFADGGIFATKPYISGSNYIKKMSDYPKGDWEELWTALYWNFIETHLDFFKANHRLSMMARLLEKMDKDKYEKNKKLASSYLNNDK